MAATKETFRYPPLPEATEWIRILQLEPSTRPDAPLRGRLVETKLDAHADYHAVSYLWGDTKTPLTDWCELRMVKTGTSDAEHKYARLPILASCNTVLRHLRWARKTRTLWIDSVCIDQSNSAEKSRQVRIMQYIYRGASKVAMWLDLSHVPAHDCKRVLKYAKMLSRAHRWGLVDIFHAKPGRISGSFKLWLIDLLPSDLRGKGGPFTGTFS